MKKHHEKIGLSVVTLAGILLASGPSFGAPCPGPANPNSVKVSVGYADNFSGGSFFPSSPFPPPLPVIVIGGSVGGVFDAGVIKLDNPSNEPLTVDNVTVHIGLNTISIWGTTPFCIPGKGTAVLTQTGGVLGFNFDTSDIGPPGACGSPNTLVPLVDVTVGANLNTKTFKDTGQVLNTGGVDKRTCPAPGPNNEGHAYVQIHP